MTARSLFPILAYHGLYSEGPRDGRNDDPYCVKESDFEIQMSIISEGGFNLLATDDIAEYRSENTSRRNLAITFDDGYESVYKIAFPILRDLGLKATVFVISGFIGRQGYLNERQILEMAEHGIDIQSHSVSHPCLPDLTEMKIQEELSASKTTLEDLVGKPVRGFAFPGGFYDRRVFRLAKDCGYKALYTSDPGLNQLFRSEMRLKRLIVKSDPNQEEFRSLAYGHRGIVLHRQCRAMLLDGLKSVLGVSLYNKYKHYLLKSYGDMF